MRARDRERVLVGDGVVIGDARAARVDVGAAELLGRHVLAGRRLHERRAADEDRAGAAHDHRLVGHRRHVGAACGARAHHDRDLRDALGGHARLVVEDPPEVVAVGEDLGLQRQERAAGVDEVDAGQVVLLGDLLRAQVLLHRQREVGAALHGRVVREDDARLTLDHADAGDDPGRRRLAVVEVPGGERAELEERRAGVDEPVDALARGQLPARAVALHRGGAAAERDERGALSQLRDERLHPRLPAGELLRVRVDVGGDRRHRWAHRSEDGRVHVAELDDDPYPLFARLREAGAGGVAPRSPPRRRRSTSSWSAPPRGLVFRKPAALVARWYGQRVKRGDSAA